MTKQIYPLENKLKELRMNLGLRQEDVAKLLGMDFTDRLCRWEKGKSIPNLVNLFKLSLLYQTTPEKLYEELFMNLKSKINLKS